MATTTPAAAVDAEASPDIGQLATDLREVLNAIDHAESLLEQLQQNYDKGDWFPSDHVWLIEGFSEDALGRAKEIVRMLIRLRERVSGVAEEVGEVNV